MCRVSKRDRIRNVRIREMCGWVSSLISWYEQAILKWYGHLLRLDEGRLVRRVFEDEVGGNRGRGRPKRKWWNGGREALRRKGIEGDGREVVVDKVI